MNFEASRFKRNTAAVALLFALAALTACRLSEAAERMPIRMVQAEAPLAGNLTDAGVSNYDPSVDYFPDKITVTHARYFRVEYHRHFKVVNFEPDIGTQETIQYLLVQRGTPLPQGYSHARVIQVPVMRFVLSQSPPAQALVFEELGVTERLIGIANHKELTVPSILRRYEQSQIKEVGSGTHSSIELTMAVDPEIIFTFYSAFPNANVHPKLWEVGVNAVPLAEGMEPAPLGRSEWLKFTALFFNQERKAEQLFVAASTRYLALKRLSLNLTEKPEVLAGWPSGRGIWSLNGGRNFFARLIEDAGGRYIWQSNFSGSLENADYERVFDESGRSPIWLGNMLTARDRKALVTADPRVQFLQPVLRNGVYSNDANRLVSGAIPFGNESLAKPDVALADLIRILHPELLPAHTLVYFRKVD